MIKQKIFPKRLNEMVVKSNPTLFVREITFNDGTKLALEHDSIVVFTGANNCGKSQVLKDIENEIDKTYKRDLIVAKSISLEYTGDIDAAEFFSKSFSKDSAGTYRINESNHEYILSEIIDGWNERSLKFNLHKLFVKRLDTENRLQQSNPLMRQFDPYKHPLYKVFKSESLAQTISEYFHQAFDVDLVVNRSEMESIPLHVGKAPNRENYTITNQDDYYSLVSQMPLLHNQGDGMRSFASVLLDAFTSEHCITLIDEPEAFLHPPQARIAGRILVNNRAHERQLFISTHSEDFLQGLLDTNNDSVIIIRIDRRDDINMINILPNSELKRLWSNPILRYSNILSGLFHDKVIVCESDYDCLFYQAIVNSLYESKGLFPPDLLFTHCGGKHRMKDVVSALVAVNVPLVAICDFDIINDKQTFKTIAQSLGIDWKQELEHHMRVIYDSMNAKQGSGKNAWEDIKRIGKAGFTGSEPEAYEMVESVCISHGLFIVPVGEMECFDKTINKEKKEWVYSVLQNYNLANENKLTSAREFVQGIVDYSN